jgi:hypothetical protein
MKIFQTLFLALALTTTVASADTAAPKKDAPAANSADVKRFLAFFDKLVDIVVADKDSCPKMAKDVNALIDSNKELLEMARKASEDGKKLPDDAQKHMSESAKKMMPAMQKCGNDKDVQAAFGRLDMKHGH